MRKNSLSKTGLSLSSAQSISNLCNQRALNIENELKNINSCEKTINVNGSNYILQKGIKLPTDIVNLLKSKGQLHACQAFLMENIKAKEKMLLIAQKNKADLSSVIKPEYPNEEDCKYLPLVDEEWGWSKLSVDELNEFYENEALSAHIGQFIHKGSKLESLRNSTTTLPSIEWTEIEVGKQTPVNIKANHTSEQLQIIHEELAKLHKTYESKVNYFKAKVKNLVTLENGRIAKLNGDEVNQVNTINKQLTSQYQEDFNNYTRECAAITAKFETERAELIKSVAALRIEVPARFQQIVTQFSE